MINEWQRQSYLSALGIENYMPRMCLPFAAQSRACLLPDLALGQEISTSILSESQDAALDLNPISVQKSSSISASEILTDIIPVKKMTVTVNAETILQQLEIKKSPELNPFSLSIWRPVTGFLIIDARNSSLALPTELLLKNILLSYLPSQELDLREEVMRWPMVENRFVARTEDDARNELQTWLSVENELRPIQKLWLMGNNAARYWLEDNSPISESYWQQRSVVTHSSTQTLVAWVTPSLIELLQQPELKARFWATVT
jgi:hypothetical protein